MSAPVALQIFVGFLLFSTVFIPLERRFPLRRQDMFRRGWKTDVAYYVSEYLPEALIEQILDPLGAGRATLSPMERRR